MIIRLALVAGSLVITVVLQKNVQHNQAKWEECAQQANGSVSEVLATCGERPYLPFDEPPDVPRKPG